MPLQVQQPAAMLPQKVPPFQEPGGIADLLDFKWKEMTADLLKQAIPAEMAAWSEGKRERIVNNLPVSWNHIPIP
jgi:hypothetical protein